MLANLTIKDFMNDLASNSPAPGGGSVAAMCGATAGNLIAMVASLTIGKKGYEEVWDEMTDLKSKMENISMEFLNLMDDDANSYQTLIQCFRLPKETDEEKTSRTVAIQAATIEATLVPLAIANRASTLFNYVKFIIEKGNKNAVSDAGVAALMAKTTILGALYNVKINVSSIKPEKVKIGFLERAKVLEKQAIKEEEEIQRLLSSL
ncbi:MAG: cyclodeaminase/cyclohydrolase family protein [Anaerovoracaceae bacterium]|jgi:formiminotetrahydrofolate cyclodeaminase